MKALFSGNVAADTANGIRAELPAEIEIEIVADPKELTPKVAAYADILVTNIWRTDYPPAPRIRLVIFIMALRSPAVRRHRGRPRRA